MSRRGRGEGSIEELPSGKFRAVLSLGVLPGGKRDRRTFTAPTKKEALAWLRARQAEREAGRLARSGRRTLGEHLALWAASKRSSLEPASHREYERTAMQDIAPAIGSVPLSQLEPRHVRHLLAAVAVDGSRAKCRKVLSFLRMALAEAVESGEVASNVAARVKLPRPQPPEIRPYSADEARALLAAPGGVWAGALAALAIDSGLRSGELLGLGWADLDLHAGLVRVERSLQQFRGAFKLKTPKTPRSRRTVLIAPSTVQALRAYRARLAGLGRLDEGVAFPARRGGWMSKATLTSGLAALARRAGVPVRRPHDLRHSCASLLLSAGVSIVAVSARLGHSSPAFTLSTYSWLMPGDQEKARETMAAILAPGK